MRTPAHADRDFVASTYIVDDGRVLLLRHTKLGKWLQPGGHIEDGETPDEAAKREAEEETGIRVELVSAKHPPRDVGGTHDLPQPFRVNLHPIREDHWHCDFGYLARPVEKGEAAHGDEHDGMRWFTGEELETYDGDLPLPESVREDALRALKEAE